MNTADHGGIGERLSVSAEMQKETSPVEQLNKSCILVVTNQSEPESSVMEYVINVADRLSSKILVACVNTRPHLQVAPRLSRLIISSPGRTLEHFRLEAQRRGVEFECIRETGKIGRVIKRLCHIVKRVEFVIVDHKIKMEEAANGSPIPVFSVVSNELHSEQTGRTRQKTNILLWRKAHERNEQKKVFRENTYFWCHDGCFIRSCFCLSGSNHALLDERRHLCTAAGCHRFCFLLRPWFIYWKFLVGSWYRRFESKQFETEKIAGYCQ